ncbi:lipopolysaccharide biosynthesis regulator YciM [Nicoletella semolina]|uniref:Lipopolysaccharide assembly protein B n=1 Tax=Nicoletella semolina TaxID=271160 RepID=A0A4R2N8F2_9PAST|nr:lipopolysaccharide assembly protein LapB [Nicoletella semolina]MDH2923833.1 lipopolysaccharide assembly protein LapB [Nicoletella semolina]TCP17145.1 lipopolysaccharide biosynthesis regulator YciM [Nicoletella semolina]
MLELLFLLLPIATLYGWYMGQRNAKKSQEQVSNKFSRDYMTGLNFLLSNQQEKAVDVFLSMLQKQESENQISLQSQFEAELTLGNLFRSRGEVDRALRIHQNLENNPDYSFEQKLLAKQQLAKDFLSAGFYDRAENYFISLVDEPEFAVNALTHLTLIYQKMREWQKAINTSEKLLKLGIDNHIPLSHYYCEYAQLCKHNEKHFTLLLEKSLKYSPNSPRALMLFGEYYLKQLNYQQAIYYFETIIERDPDYIGEVLQKIEYCYQQLNQIDNFELFLIRAAQVKNNSRIDIALADRIAQKDGIEAAQFKLYKQVKQHPNLFTFHHFIYYQMNSAKEGQGKENLALLHQMVGDRIQKGFQYRCLNCGYQSYKLIWYCPSCREWESIKPISSINDVI